MANQKKGGGAPYEESQANRRQRSLGVIKKKIFVSNINAEIGDWPRDQQLQVAIDLLSDFCCENKRMQRVKPGGFVPRAYKMVGKGHNLFVAMSRLRVSPTHWVPLIAL